MMWFGSCGWKWTIWIGVLKEELSQFKSQVAWHQLALTRVSIFQDWLQWTDVQVGCLAVRRSSFFEDDGKAFNPYRQRLRGRIYSEPESIGYRMGSIHDRNLDQRAPTNTFTSQRRISSHSQHNLGKRQITARLGWARASFAHRIKSVGSNNIFLYSHL